MGQSTSAGVRSCSCVPQGGSLLADDLDDSFRHGVEEIGVDADDSESEDCSTEDGDSQDPRRKLTFVRHRLFAPHQRTKFADHYRIEKLLGEGSYGNVYQAVAVPAAGASGFGEHRSVAAKCFSLQRGEPRKGETLMDAEARHARDASARRSSFEKERSVLSRLEHPHIIKMFEVFEDAEELWIVLELCLGGELYEQVADRVRRGTGAGLEEDVGCMFFRQMLHAVAYLHANSVVHRDVKSENFLLLGPPGSKEANLVKLCDYGTAIQLTEQMPRAMERIGTLSYTAPEIYARRGATVMADMWSLGVVLYVLLVGASPFRITGEEPRQDTLDRIAAGRFDTSRPAWNGLSDKARNLICLFLVVDERQRLRAFEALAHPWVDAASRTPADWASGSPTSPPQLPAVGHHRERLLHFADHSTCLLSMFGKLSQLDFIQQLVLTVCAQMTPEAELVASGGTFPLYDLFFAMDANEDGRIDVAEFVSGMKVLLGASNIFSDVELVSLACVLDLDGSGAVDWVEWSTLALLAGRGPADVADTLQAIFRALDRPSGDGCFGVMDLFALVTSGTSADCFDSRRARNFACQALNRWAGRAMSSKTWKRRLKNQALPFLVPGEMRTVLLSAVGGTDTSIWPLSVFDANHFGACASCCNTMAPLPLGQAMIKQQRALAGPVIKSCRV